jgi:hypothetical protein
MTDNKSPPTAATLDEFNALHAELASAFTRELKRCKKEKISPSPQFLAQLRQFLSDNGVNVPARSPRIDRLADQIPDMDELERGNVVPMKRPPKEKCS